MRSRPRTHNGLSHDEVTRGQGLVPATGGIRNLDRGSVASRLLGWASRLFLVAWASSAGGRPWFPTHTRYSEVWAAHRHTTDGLFITLVALLTAAICFGYLGMQVQAALSPEPNPKKRR